MLASAWKNGLACAALVACLLCNVGCGGGDPQHFRGVTPFVGSWSGTWSGGGAVSGGSMSLTIANDATMYGAYLDLATGETGVVRGATHPDGTFTASFTADGTNKLTPISAIMQLVHPSGSTAVYLAGDGVYTRPAAASTSFKFDLFTHDSPVTLTGGYAGTWTVPGGVDKGTLQWIVAQSGAISGTFTNTTTGISGTVTGTSVENGDFVAAFLPTGGGPRTVLSGIQGTGSVTVNGVKTNAVIGSGTYTPAGGTSQPFNFTVF